MSAPEARELVLEALYEADARGMAPDEEFLTARAKRIVSGIGQHRGEIDAAIARLAEGWRLERMPAVDRNILRLGVYELEYTDVPVGVAVSEAVDLAKKYSTEKSGAFVNGVLGKLAQEVVERRKAEA